MSDPRSDPSGVRTKPADATMTEAAMNELAELTRDVRSMAAEIRDRISLASEDSQEAWIELDQELERFYRTIEQTPEESVSELRKRAFALKRHLRTLRSEIKPGSS